MKLVMFMGYMVKISDTAKFLAADQNGEVWEYFHRPRPRPGHFGGVWVVGNTEGARRVQHPTVEGAGVLVEFDRPTRWKETLAVVADLQVVHLDAADSGAQDQTGSYIVRPKAFIGTSCNFDYYDGTLPGSTVIVCTLNCAPADANSCAAILVDRAPRATDLAEVYERALETLASIIDALRAVNATGTVPSKAVH